jgi:hypothetical protein
VLVTASSMFAVGVDSLLNPITPGAVTTVEFEVVIIYAITPGVDGSEVCNLAASAVLDAASV